MTAQTPSPLRYATTPDELRTLPNKVEIHANRFEFDSDDYLILGFDTEYQRKGGYR